MAKASPLNSLVQLMRKNLAEDMFDDEEFIDEVKFTGSKMWAFSDNIYYPVGNTCKKLPPDYYLTGVNRGEPVLRRLNFNTTDLITFSEDTIDKVVKEITRFWDSEEKFENADIPYRRGILMWGPPGTGKSCTVKLILKEVIAKGGIGLKFSSCGSFDLCMEAIRKIQPTTPVVCVMEDVESILQNDSESDILNILDGVAGYEKIVYLATTNYPEELGERISNRPSRFDKRYEISYPNEKSRETYIKHLLRNIPEQDHPENLAQWVKDTKNFTPAHIKELFISVVLYGDEYGDVITNLKDMGKQLKSNSWKKKTGFGVE